MKTFTYQEMIQCQCPYKFRHSDPDKQLCWATRCIACEEVHPKVSMAEHSGGLRMREIASKRGRSSSFINRTSEGGEIVLRLEAEYTCRRLYKDNPE